MHLRTGNPHRRSAGTTAIVVLALASPAIAQQPEYTARIDSIFAEWDRTGSPGCAVGVTREGRLEFARGYGMADLDHGVPISPSTVFYLASVSKQFTAATVALAAQQGHLSLDDDIRKWFPELPQYERPITVRNLVHHTSGIRDYLELMPMAGMRWADVLTDEEMLRLIARQKAVNFEPGSRYLYSNSGYVLLAELIERATGQSLRAFSREHLFGPLGMYDTHFHDDASEVVPNRAIGYERGADGLRMNHLWNFDKVGDGGLYSTVEDLARWDANFVDLQVGGQTFLHQILQRGVLTGGDTIDYAFALSHGDYRGVPTIEHGGGFMAFRTNFLRLPDQSVGTIVLCNTPTDPARLARRVADVVIGDRLGPVNANAAAPEFIDLPAGQVAARAGVYRDADTGQVIRLETADRGLAARLFGQRAVFRPIAPTVFRAVDFPADVRLAFDGDAMSVHVAGGDTTTYRRIEPVAPAAAELRAYAGDYFSDELDTVYRVAAADGGLVMYPPLGEELELQPTLRDEFAGPDVVIRFQRRDGRVSGFILDGGRVKGLRFERR